MTAVIPRRQPYEAVEENLRAAMRCYAAVSEAGEASDGHGLSLTSSGLNAPVFNSALLTNRTKAERFAYLLQSAKQHFHVRGLGWVFWLCADLMDRTSRFRARDMMRAEGMHQIAQPPGMLADRLSESTRPAADLQFRRVADNSSRFEFAHLSSLIFSLAMQQAHPVYTAPRLWSGVMEGWIGYHRGTPVTIGSIVLAAGVAGVYSLGTLPEYQGRGFARTLLRHALDDVKRRTGVERTVLQSTRQGLNLYTKLGYRIVTEFDVYLHEGYGRRA
jgi:ribosomal protein S18 acetylase RimI-like enzyme